MGSGGHIKVPVASLLSEPVIYATSGEACANNEACEHSAGDAAVPGTQMPPK